MHSQCMGLCESVCLCDMRKTAGVARCPCVCERSIYEITLHQYVPLQEPLYEEGEGEFGVVRVYALIFACVPMCGQKMAFCTADVIT